ncbi:MAG: hypothetical protein WA127_05520 [Methanothrix sp.]|jgi:hypothetical protein
MLKEATKQSLRNRENLKSKKRADTTYRLRNQLQKKLDILADIKFLLQELPPSKNEISQEHLENAMSIVESLATILDPWPVVDTEENGLWKYRTVATTLEPDLPGKCSPVTYAMPASLYDIALNERLKNHITALQYRVDPYLIDPDCKNRTFGGDFAHHITEHGGWSNRYVHHYMGDNPYAGTNKIEHIAPITLDKSELKFKRWNPDKLPKKYEVPEQEKDHPKEEPK